MLLACTKVSEKTLLKNVVYSIVVLPEYKFCAGAASSEDCVDIIIIIVAFDSKAM